MLFILFVFFNLWKKKNALKLVFVWSKIRITTSYLNRSVLEPGDRPKPYYIVKKIMCEKSFIGQTEGEIPCDWLGKSNKCVAVDVAQGSIATILWCFMEIRHHRNWTLVRPWGWAAGGWTEWVLLAVMEGKTKQKAPSFGFWDTAVDECVCGQPVPWLLYSKTPFLKKGQNSQTSCLVRWAWPSARSGELEDEIITRNRFLR